MDYVTLVHSTHGSVLDCDHKHVVRSAFQLRHQLLLAGDHGQVISLKKIKYYVEFMINQK